MSKIVAIIQVRLDSNRFPRKALADIIGKPMILHLIERVKKSKLINEIVIATTTRKIDDPLVEAVKNYGIKIFRGDCDDVLDRYYTAAKKHEADIVVRITGVYPIRAEDVDIIIFEDDLLDIGIYTWARSESSGNHMAIKIFTPGDRYLRILVQQFLKFRMILCQLQ